jgi:ribonucleoside-diphosphate reductase alpha chain
MIIDYSRDNLLEEFSIKTLKDRYLLPHETSPQEAFARAALTFADDDAHAQRLYDYASKHWFMFATPLLSNGGSSRGLPISCFLNYVEDSRHGITEVFTEDAFLSSVGGGIGTYWGDVRSTGIKTSSGSESTGVIPFMKVTDGLMLAFSQGVTRRGSNAAYLDISHPEIGEFLDIRKPTGDVNRMCLNLHHGVIISDKFMRLIERATEAKAKGEDFNDSWPLIDPHTKEVVKTVSARALWIKIIQNRAETGEPYIMFGDTVNDALPDFQQRLGLKVRQSNLCSEITLATDANRTAVCCLSSVNAEKFDEWKDDPNFIPDLIRMLDNVIQVFIDNAPEQLYKAIYSATRERSLGLGLMGFHAYLQSKMIPLESPMAKGINKKIFSHIKKQAKEETIRLADERGPCPDAKGVENIRNAHLLAIAPNASSSIICGNTSPGIEPFRANAFNQKTMSGTSMMKNKYLEKVLADYDKNDDHTWASIIASGGSVAHLEFLSDYERAVFKTAIEIDQRWIVELAADRTEYICQAQSLNLFFPPDVSKQELHYIHLLAWKKGVKTLYYLRSEAIKRSDDLSKKTEKHKFNFEAPITGEECLACEG